jgi:hypothetical protein
MKVMAALIEGIRLQNNLHCLPPWKHTGGACRRPAGAAPTRRNGRKSPAATRSDDRHATSLPPLASMAGQKKRKQHHRSTDQATAAAHKLGFICGDPSHRAAPRSLQPLEVNEEAAPVLDAPGLAKKNRRPTPIYRHTANTRPIIHQSMPGASPQPTPTGSAGGSGLGSTRISRESSQATVDRRERKKGIE